MISKYVGGNNAVPMLKNVNRCYALRFSARASTVSSADFTLA